MKTSDDLVKYARNALAEGWVYWYGTTGNPCSEDLLTRKAKQYPDHYTPDRMAAYRRQIAEKRRCADCINLVKGFMWLDESTGKQIYQSNGCPDTNANGMFSRAVDKGDIASMPDLPGLIVRFNGHAGVYVGQGKVIEARGFKYGVVMTDIDSRPWTHWYKMPGLSYPDSQAVEYLPGDRLLRKGSKGDDVRRLQSLLIGAGYALPRFGTDGSFGSETESAVILFQQENGLTPDGICGPATMAALTALTEDGTDDTNTTEAGKDTIAVKADTAIIRTGAGGMFEPLTIAPKGTVLTRLDTTGWIAVLVNGRVGFIEAKDTI